MTFEFMYGDTWYKYHDDRILKQNEFGKYDEYFDYFCPVLKELSEKLESFSADQLHTIMGAIIHGYCWGHKDGKAAKVREVKRVLCID